MTYGREAVKIEKNVWTKVDQSVENGELRTTNSYRSYLAAYKLLV